MEQELTLEVMFEQLEEVITQLESEEISLEDSFQVYQKGMKLIQDCNQRIDKVEKEVQVLNENGELHDF